MSKTKKTAVTTTKSKAAKAPSVAEKQVSHPLVKYAGLGPHGFSVKPGLNLFSIPQNGRFLNIAKGDRSMVIVSADRPIVPVMQVPAEPWLRAMIETEGDHGASVRNLRNWARRLEGEIGSPDCPMGCDSGFPFNMFVHAEMWLGELLGVTINRLLLAHLLEAFPGSGKGEFVTLGRMMVETDGLPSAAVFADSEDCSVRVIVLENVAMARLPRIKFKGAERLMGSKSS